MKSKISERCTNSLIVIIIYQQNIIDTHELTNIFHNVSKMQDQFEHCPKYYV